MASGLRVALQHPPLWAAALVWDAQVFGVLLFIQYLLLLFLLVIRQCLFLTVSTKENILKRNMWMFFHWSFRIGGKKVKRT